MRLFIVLFVALMFLVSGCDIIFGPSGISPDDPYDADCNLKESYHKEWKKYSDFDYRIEQQSRSYQAQQYYNAVDRIAAITGEMHALQRDTEVESLMRQELVTYRNSLARGHTQNLVKSFLRLSMYTADITWQHAIAGKGYADLLTGPALSGIKMAGESAKLINSYAPSDSLIAIDTSTVEGQLNDVAREGWLETVTNIEELNPKDVASAMAKKAARYVMEVPDPKLSDAEIGILKQEHLELKRVDTLIQDADKRNFERLWQVRALEQERTDLKGSLFDLEYDEKDRVDAMLIGECKRKIGDEDDHKESDGNWFINLLFGGGGS